LEGRHWLKWEPGRGGKDGQDIAEIGGSDHFDVFNTGKCE
jgi:hypothetical protein